MNKIVLGLTAAFLLTFSSSELADETHPNNHGSGHSTTAETPSSHQMPGMTSDQHEMPGMSSEQHQNMQSHSESQFNSHSGHEMPATEGHGEGHGTGERVAGCGVSSFPL